MQMRNALKRTCSAKDNRSAITARICSAGHHRARPDSAAKTLVCCALKKFEQELVSSKENGSSGYTQSRRGMLAASVALLSASFQSEHRATAAGSSDEPASPPSLAQYTNSSQGYSVSVLSKWEKIDKAGADVLFEDPSRRSTSLGVTVNPVRVADISSFGSLEAVGEKLLEAERKKESTLSASMVSQSSRRLDSGALLYDYEYDLDSTRGHKRILNTVTIFKSKLYILNAMYKCEKSDVSCSSEDAVDTVATLRGLASSFVLLV